MQLSAMISLTLPTKACDYCGRALQGKGAPTKLKINKLHGSGEEPRGSGVAEMTRDYVRCPGCGSIFEELLHVISVQSENFECSRCKGPEHVDYAIKALEGEDTYEFTASISCAKCNRTRSLTKTLSDLGAISGLSVGQVGISAEETLVR